MAERLMTLQDCERATKDSRAMLTFFLITMIVLPPSFVSFLGMNLSLKGQELDLTLVYWFIGLSTYFIFDRDCYFAVSAVGYKEFCPKVILVCNMLDRCSVQAIGSGI